jgi:hypothetical protein
MIKSKRKREKMNAYMILVGNPEGERSLGRQRRRWEDNIKMDLREVVWGSMDGLVCRRMGTSGWLL